MNPNNTPDMEPWFRQSAMALDVAVCKAEALLMAAGAHPDLVKRAVEAILNACVEAVENSGIETRPADVIREVAERSV